MNRAHTSSSTTRRAIIRERLDLLGIGNPSFTLSRELANNSRFRKIRRSKIRLWCSLIISLIIPVVTFPGSLRFRDDLPTIDAACFHREHVGSRRRLLHALLRGFFLFYCATRPVAFRNCAATSPNYRPRLRSRRSAISESISSRLARRRYRRNIARRRKKEKRSGRVKQMSREMRTQPRIGGLVEIARIPLMRSLVKLSGKSC